ncbi:MAG: hypothetical protein K9J16_09785 [Melioribacteraceae bacterium]|nr:hypothetical protein [Melioribacteraceae bacterium]MCF8356103.1 hypothetical protein [Melioribacteraceae bacterium]MCF8395587.1 hypothetical protein [Melioribacteraceae bacterium]MCF8419689.1 hypothetical protein [Melioribacteraceae bacterium]
MKKPVICIYCEGSDTKLGVFTKEENQIKIHRLLSVDIEAGGGDSLAEDSLGSELELGDLGDGIDLGNVEGDFGNVPVEQEQEKEGLDALVAGLSDIKLSSASFVPVITEPILTYHQYEGEKLSDKNKFRDVLIKDILNTKNIYVAKDGIDFIDHDETSVLTAFIEGDIPCVNVVNRLAQAKKKRYYKIDSIKSAEIALAHYVSKTNKYFPEDYILIIYTGKEYSKLIFLEGQKLKHIGSTLDIGTKNLQTYDVYFSKILLEMENGGIPRLDNVVLCGDDNSENLLLSFYGTFPEAEVESIKFNSLDLSLLEEEQKEILAAFAMPISAAIEFFEEQETKKPIGINLLPDYIKENQKFLQFGWHSYAMLPVLFGLTVYFTVTLLSNVQTINSIDNEIDFLLVQQQKNQMLLDQMNPLSERILSFDNTKEILDSAAVGTEVWTNIFTKYADFFERRRNFWLSKMQVVDGREILLTGYSLSRTVLTEFAKFTGTAELKNIIFEPLRETNAFTFTITIKLENLLAPAGKNGP